MDPSLSDRDPNEIADALFEDLDLLQSFKSPEHLWSDRSTLCSVQALARSLPLMCARANCFQARRKEGGRRTAWLSSKLQHTQIRGTAAACVPPMMSSCLCLLSATVSFCISCLCAPSVSPLRRHWMKCFRFCVVATWQRSSGPRQSL